LPFRGGGGLSLLYYKTNRQRTGLGLSLSLSSDIVKAHGGEIKVDTKEDEGSQVVIQFPIL
jgi:two-component system NtrC family sensor kinase